MKYKYGKHAAILAAVVLVVIVAATKYIDSKSPGCDRACNAGYANTFAYTRGWEFARDYGYCPSIKEATATGENRAWLKGCRSYGS